MASGGGPVVRYTNVRPHNLLQPNWKNIPESKMTTSTFEKSFENQVSAAKSDDFQCRKRMSTNNTETFS